MESKPYFALRVTLTEVKMAACVNSINIPTTTLVVKPVHC
jgi:hypothetical protein